MDHHCVFINNCVGDGNQRFFVRFLVTIVSATLYGAGYCCWVVLRSYRATGMFDFVTQVGLCDTCGV